MYRFLHTFRDRWLLRSALRQGLVLGRGSRIIGRPEFGSEPYLIEIGDHVTVSSNVTFLTHDGATWVFRDEARTRGLQHFARIRIGNNCFIGANVTILPGLSIGSNCVVGAGAVVTRSIPDNTVVAGVPARFICTYADYVSRTAPRCLYFEPEVLADRDRLREVLLATLPPAGQEESVQEVISR